MNRLIQRAAAAVATGLLLSAAACGGGGDSSDSAQPAGDSQSESPTATTTVETAQSDFGTILVDSEGMTLYMFDPDEQGKSVCDAECLQAWPPVEGPAEAGNGVDASLLGTTKATDGTTMATYDDWPLYYWAQDKQPGDVTGQAVKGVWWVMSPDGRPIREEPQATGGDDSAARAATTVETSGSRFGRILVDSKGRTLYMFDPDEQGRSVCDAECLQAWPVAKAPGAAGKGADDSLLGTTKATDGTRMVTYNDWPLYYFAQDGRPGDINGQGANGVWWVLSPEGRPIRQ